MPYKSEAQRKKFHAMLARGKIKQKIVDEFDKASVGLKLPERIKPKAKSTDDLRVIYKKKFGK